MEMRKRLSTLAFGATMAISAMGATPDGYRIYYNVGDQSLNEDPEVVFTHLDSFTDANGNTTAVFAGIKDIPASVNSGYIYWNIAPVDGEATGDMLFDSPKNVSFSSKKSKESWLRVVVSDADAAVDSKAVSSGGFRAYTADGNVTMTPASGHKATASLTFSGTDKTFCIHYGSVNSESDLGVLTHDIAVSATCLAADITYDFLTNGVSINETKWGSPSIDAGIDPEPEDCARCFAEDTEAKTITFIMDNRLWRQSGINRMEVRGSFNGWGSDPRYAMKHDEERDIWYVTLPTADVNVPGNSGQPEFKFVSNSSNYLGGTGKSFIPEGYIFLNGDNNNIIVFAADDFDLIKENSRTANVLKSVSDFDLTTEAGQEEISNFRRVPGTMNLYRSYHPYKITKLSNPTEPYRMKYVAELAAEHGITCDICLSENEERNLQSFNIAGTPYQEAIPAYYQDIIDNGRVLYVGATSSVPTYNVVYYTPESATFGNWVKEIVEFIIDDRNPGPFEIHCRIGTDRTGAFSGVLAALCGATWDQIATDYQLTNRMGIQEFRDYHLLQYGFQKLLGVEDIHSVADLQSAMRNHFVSNGYLSDNQIDMLKAKLAGPLSGVAEVEEAANTPAVLYDLQGLPTSYTLDNAPAGIYIVVEGGKARKVAL